MIKDGYLKDGLYSSVTGSGVEATLAFTLEDGLWYKEGKLCIPEVPEVRNQLLYAFHDAPYSGHMGIAKTLRGVSREYYWPSLADDVKQYVRCCGVCQRDKSRNQKPGGLLQPLQIPEQSWNSISMDFITDLPVTNNGNDGILVFVDRLTKMTMLRQLV